MPLQSLEFLVFLSTVFTLYWSLCRNSARAQNILLTLSGLLFYAWADWRFVSLLVLSTLTNFYLGRRIYESKTRDRSWLLYTGLAFNTGILFYFKYPGFSNIILPLGISFFTFQALAYLIDLSREDIRPASSLLDFAVFFTYFPKMTAGPIEKAEAFLPQIEKKRVFDEALAVDGLRQILWGAFAKLVIADNCAAIATPVFDNYHRLPASTLLLGSFFYLFQVYGDFSGYSNIAIGISKLFGIRLMRNFAAPFFSTNSRDYWRKWHISLSSWAMRYIFLPVSFALRRYRQAGLVLSVLVTFLVIGLWHGANGTFIVFGLLHGLYFIPLILRGSSVRSRPATQKPPAVGTQPVTQSGTRLPSFKQGLQMLGWFLLVMLTMIFFGARNISQADQYLGRLFSPSILSAPVFPEQTGAVKAMATFLFIGALLSVEWLQKDKTHEMQIEGIKNPAWRMGIYYSILLFILLFGSVVHLDFLYSQF